MNTRAAAVSEAPPRGIVRVVREHFELDGARIVPHGVNSYPLLQLAGCGRWDAVEEVFAQARSLGRPWVRTNAFMEGGDNPARLREVDGSLREAGLCVLDALLVAAARAGVRLLLVLANQWPDFGGAPAIVRGVLPSSERGEPDAFWTQPRAIATQRAYVAALAGRTNTQSGQRYAQDTSIFAWELANEPRCYGPARRTPAALIAWSRSMREALIEVGVQQPIAWGGSGYCGKYGEDMRALGPSGAVDILTLHLYPQQLVPGFRGLARRWRVAASIALGKRVLRHRAHVARRCERPLLLEELGYRAPARARDRDGERAAVLGALLEEADRLGLSSWPWMIGERGRVDHDGFLIRPSDAHSCAVLARRGSALRVASAVRE